MDEKSEIRKFNKYKKLKRKIYETEMQEGHSRITQKLVDEHIFSFKRLDIRFYKQFEVELEQKKKIRKKNKQNSSTF